MYGARHTDPVTSHLSARDTPERVSQRDRILLAYYLADFAITDHEASVRAGVLPRSCWWKRCSELRAAGLIGYDTWSDGQSVLVKGDMGRPVHTCRITEQGRHYLTTKGLA